MKQPAVLDFTADGGAVVKILDVGEVAYLDMFGFSPISKVESDIEHADTSDRKRFLEKYLRVYCEMYGEQDDAKWTKEITAFKETLAQYIPAIVADSRFYQDCVGEEQYNEAWKVIEREDCEELEDVIEELSLHELKIGGYVLKHSSAWYMFRNVDADVKAAKMRIEQAKGLPKVIDNIDKVLGIIRHAKGELDAQQTLQKELGMTDIQAKHVVSFGMSQLTGIRLQDVMNSMDEYQKRLDFLEKIWKK
ncbi:MAG: hypothetical protein K6E93_01485 [Bacteroidales bacterium]|nr:hypothetical protein [Bacteroidales bacterium]